MPTEPVAPLRGALLGLITHHPMSGYDLAKAFDASLGYVWSAKHTQIYPELAAMLEEGLVTVRSAGPRGRKEYSVTKRGREELSRWLTEHTPQPTTNRNEALLRAFFLGYLSLEEAQALLRFERDRHTARLELYLDEAARPETSEGGWTGDIMLEAGIRYERALIAWAEWAGEEIERRRCEPATVPSRAAKRRSRRASAGDDREAA